MSSRAQIAANALASVRLEGLEPSAEARELGDAWARGEATYADLVDAEERLLARAAIVTSCVSALRRPARESVRDPGFRGPGGCS